MLFTENFSVGAERVGYFYAACGLEISSGTATQEYVLWHDTQSVCWPSAAHTSEYGVIVPCTRCLSFTSFVCVRCSVQLRLGTEIHTHKLSRRTGFTGFEALLTDWSSRDDSQSQRSVLGTPRLGLGNQQPGTYRLHPFKSISVFYKQGVD